MELSQKIHDAGQEVSSSDGTDLPGVLNACLGRFLGWPFKCCAARVIDREGNATEVFASVVHSAVDAGQDHADIPADAAAAVIDAHAIMDLETFRAAYRRVAQAKRLRKASPPKLPGTAVTTITLGIIFALRCSLPLETIAEELGRLNAQTPDREWPDMIAISSTGIIHYAVQFPGEPVSGDFLPPAEGATAKFTAPLYIVMVMRPTGTYTFNKMTAFLIAHLAIFSPGAKLDNWSRILDGVPREAIIISGYQYNLKGELLPVPRQFYNDRYFPPPPLRIESQKGELLSTIQFLPWQDGGTVLLRGKLPLDGLMVFFGKKGLERGGIVRRPPDVQISYVVPITQRDFREMLARFQRQSNMVVKSGEGQWVVQKFADEGSSSPFVARIFMGLLRLRDIVYPDPAARESFDKPYEFVSHSLMNTRATAKEIGDLWQEHARKVASGETARIQGHAIQIDENIDKELRKQVESFLNSAVRTLKQGMQELGNELHVDIGFMFKKQGAFAAGIAALRASDPLLAEYLVQTRAWSEPLLQCRNDIEHTGWTLPRVTYVAAGAGVTAQEPAISGRPVTEFVMFMLDRLCCFVEEFSAHALQRLMPSELTITEIPPAARAREAPERFRLTIGIGGQPRWNITYHVSLFEET